MALLHIGLACAYIAAALYTLMVTYAVKGAMFYGRLTEDELWIAFGCCLAAAAWPVWWSGYAIYRMAKWSVKR